MPDPTPLSAEELAELRERHQRAMSVLAEPSSARHDVARLLATLDAAAEERDRLQTEAEELAGVQERQCRAERERIVAAVEALPGYIESKGRGELVPYVVLRAAVLAAIRGADGEPDATLANPEARAAVHAVTQPEPVCGDDYDSHDWNRSGAPTFCRRCRVEFPTWNRRRSEPAQALQRGGLDAAWAEAEAALPEGWRIRVERLADGYIAEMTYPARWELGAFVRSDHATPIEALRALTAKLREAPATPEAES